MAGCGGGPPKDKSRWEVKVDEGELEYDPRDLEIGMLPPKRVFDKKTYPKQGHICKVCNKVAARGLHEVMPLAVNGEVEIDGLEGTEMCHECLNKRSLDAGVQLAQLYESYDDVDNEVKGRELTDDDEFDSPYFEDDEEGINNESK